METQYQRLDPLGHCRANSMAIKRVGAMLVIIIGALFTAPIDKAHAISFRTVALYGDETPDPETDSFTKFGLPVINALGQTAFSASAIGSELSPGLTSGIWSEGGEKLHRVYPSEETPKYNVSNVIPILSGSGTTSFFVGQGLYAEEFGGLRSVAQPGDFAPGIGTGARFLGFNSSSLNSHVFNNLGKIAFSAMLRGTSVGQANNQGIWSDRSGSLELITRAGMHAPDTESGINFAGVGLNSVEAFSDPVLSNSGHIAFRAGLVGSGVSAINDSGIWADRGLGLELVARAGSPAPGTDDGIVFAGRDFSPKPKFGEPSINDAGQIAFYAQLSGERITGTNDSGIWSERGGQLQLLTRTGAQVPGFGSDAYFSRLGEPLINGKGDVVFWAEVAGDSVDNQNSGIWIHDANGLRLIARAGQHAPGISDGTILLPFSQVVNNAGQIVFLAYLNEPSAHTANALSIWADGPSGLELIAREGGPIMIAPGEVRTIYSLKFFLTRSGNQDGRRSYFNDAGQLAFYAEYNGGAGVFVATLSPIPEPQSVWLFLTAMAALCPILTRNRKLLVHRA